MPSIVAAVKVGQGVFIVNQGHGRMFGEHVVVRPLKPPPEPAVFVLAYRKEGVSVAIAAFVAVARTAKLR